MFGLFNSEAKAARLARLATARQLYQTILEQARNPILYTQYQVPDTVDGRYDLILLHAIVVIDLLQGAAESGQKLGQGIFDIMFRDLENGVREIGVSDMSIARHFRRMSQGFNGRRIAYSAALAAQDAAVMQDAVTRNIFRKSTDDVAASAAQLTQYIFAQYNALQTAGLDKLFTGTAHFSPLTALAA